MSIHVTVGMCKNRTTSMPKSVHHFESGQKVIYFISECFILVLTNCEGGTSVSVISTVKQVFFLYQRWVAQWITELTSLTPQWDPQPNIWYQPPQQSTPRQPTIHACLRDNFELESISLIKLTYPGIIHKLCNAKKGHRGRRIAFAFSLEYKGQYINAHTCRIQIHQASIEINQKFGFNLGIFESNLVE